MQTKSQNEELRELLGSYLVSLPTNHRPSQEIAKLSDTALSFETVFAISKDVIDYRSLAIECWTLMSSQISFGLDRNKQKVLRNLCFLALKFPEYFRREDLQILIFEILPQPSMDPIKNPEEEFYSRTRTYLKNFHSLMRVHTSVDPDILGYYTAETSAIRENGVCAKLIRAAKLFFADK